MFVGYPDNHASDTYRMWDPTSHWVHVTRDVQWLKKNYFAADQISTDIKFLQDG
jgi:hypothetical protein